ncbi:MAG: 2-C-methyl-D-erythritol 2,4-cyclodiphosphate synthase, partial [Candidatus Dadabacteria bacterium]|nr:2-C-methyl-D-erythritol 2,4-cyclodiphosphate synthase [Candidatus Dadabacteria bacterium]NIQ17092.1 2-C-methyl-D-erythritol 2,4-cyclodiphosphate synthase [Candidatus Dadabacteria bacterium]
MYRIGIGYDAHRLVKGGKLILGGVEIPYELGLKGHSDADVLTHAICDAVLGSVAEGDIGKHFPDNDQKYKDISSLELLIQTQKILSDKGYKIENIDSTIICQEPKLSPYIMNIRDKISSTLGISIENVSVKATTTEKMGFTGRKEGIAAQAIVL